MHYFQFNIGDYSSHTSRLALMEDLAYRRLLDLYYLQETPFIGTSTDVAREIGMKDHESEVGYILSKFFHKKGKKWINKRADREIAFYQKVKEQRISAGKASAKARADKASKQVSNERSTSPQLNNNQQPITNNHKQDKKKVAKATCRNLVSPMSVVELYNSTYKDMPPVQKRAPTKTLLSRISVLSKKDFKTLEDWGKFFDSLKLSEWLMSEVPPQGKFRQFRLKLEWIIKPDNLSKIFDGHYHGE